MSKEYIDRQLLLDSICEYVCEATPGIKLCYGNCPDVKQVLESPAVDVAPVVHSSWVIINDIDGYADYEIAVEVTPDNEREIRQQYPGYSSPRCMDCRSGALLNGAEEYVLSHFCPNCGAKMDGGVIDV